VAGKVRGEPALVLGQHEHLDDLGHEQVSDHSQGRPITRP
jgi:hypothetical protein